MAETVTYDGYALYQTLGELQGLFAELRYIDTAMQYLEGEEAGCDGWRRCAVAPRGKTDGSSRSNPTS